MKFSLVAVAAAMVAGASASQHHQHESFHKRGAFARAAHNVTDLYPTLPQNGTEECGCYTTWVTTYGEPTLAPAPPKPKPTTSEAPVVEVKPTPTPEEVKPTTSEAPAPVETIVVPVVPQPTAEVSVFPTPGTYTIPATTITVTHETTVCEATTTAVPSGTHTFGGVTTIVETATTIVCPIATVETTNGVVTSTIRETTYVCPSAGTYTIAPTTTECVESTVFVYPTPHVVAPGTYTKPEEIVTVTVPNFVYICPAPVTETPALPTKAPEPVSPAPAPVVEAPKPVVEAPKPVVEAPKPVVEAPKPAVEAPKPVVEVPKPVVEAPKPVAEVPKPATTATTPKKPVSKAKISTSQGPSLGDNTDHWAITYTPYTYDGQCKGASEVMSDLAEIKNKGFSTIRLYSADKTDCNGLENVSAGCVAHGLYMIVGVFVKNTGLAGAQPQIDELAKFQHWNIVSLVVIGNEAIFAGFCTAPELAAFIHSAKTTFQGAGYNGPVTTTEPLNVLQQHASTLCDVVDVMGANIHPFFNSDVTAETCGEFAKGQLDIVETLCPGKQGINLEIGWPSAGKCNGAACPGKQEQATAMRGIREKLGGKSVFFSFHDDLWKEPGEFGCERSWGIGGLF